ncbi:MAG: hypothetical protein SGPRY_010768 [Prymnesium sp.]
MAAPSKKIDSFRTVGVSCSKCGQLLFRYKKKNGMKSNLVKCYIERICADSAGLLAAAEEEAHKDAPAEWRCPSCNTQFARDALIHGRPALKMIGGKVRMIK